MKNKKKLLAMLLLGAAVGVSAFALGGCSNKNKDKDKGDNPGGDTDITDPDTPLDQGGCKHEGVSHVDAVSAGCVTGGNKEYWYCASCGKYYSDSALTVETSLASVTLGAVGHSYGAWSNGTPADCTTDGEKAHKDCTVCHKHFDAENNEITNLTITAGHNYGEWIAEVPAHGCTDGVHGHYHCDGCGSDFNDKYEEYGSFPWQAGPLKITAPHNIKHYEAEKASCTVDGHDEYWQCEDCETYFDQYGNVAFEEPLFTPGDHDYGEFVYDYTAKKYVKTCKHESTHTVAQAAGTEDYPYLAKDEATLKEAIALGGHIKLVGDITADVVIAKDATVTLNLNGHTLTNAASHTVENHGKLTVLGGGTLYNGTHKMAALENKGVATVNGITLQRTFAKDETGKATNSWYTIENNGEDSDGKVIDGVELTLIDVTVLTDPADTFTSLVRNLYATMTIESGNYTSSKIALKNDEKGVLTVKGGTFSAASGKQSFQNYGKATINGGTFQGRMSTNAYKEFIGETIIAGGNVSADQNIFYYESAAAYAAPVIKVANGITVNAPTFTIYGLDEKKTSSDCYAVVTTEDTENVEYTLSRPTLVNDATSFNAALAEGGKIKLVSNVNLTEAGDIAVTNDVVIDLNGKTLTAAKNVTFTAKEGGSLSFLNGKLVMSNSKKSNASLYVEKGSSVTLDGVSMKTNSYGIFPAGDAASVIVKDSVIRSTASTAIGTNAKTVDNYNVIITIDNSTLFGYFEAMLINVPGTINATNSTFYGINRAIVLRSGTAKLTDCTLQDNVSALDDEGNITRCLTTTTDFAGTFNSYYDVTQSGSWGSGNAGIPLNVLVVGNGKGSYVNQASCELIGCTLVDDFVGITGTDAEFVHHTIYATTDGTDGAVANVIYDAATAEKSTDFTFKADNAATINQTVA